MAMTVLTNEWRPIHARMLVGGDWTELLNTDSTHYGGSDVGNLGAVHPEPVPWHGQPVSAEVTLPPLAAVWLVPDTD